MLQTLDTAYIEDLLETSFCSLHGFDRRQRRVITNGLDVSISDEDTLSVLRALASTHWNQAQKKLITNFLRENNLRALFQVLKWDVFQEIDNGFYDRNPDVNWRDVFCTMELAPVRHTPDDILRLFFTEQTFSTFGFYHFLSQAYPRASVTITEYKTKKEKCVDDLQFRRSIELNIRNKSLVFTFRSPWFFCTYGLEDTKETLLKDHPLLKVVRKINYSDQQEVGFCTEYKSAYQLWQKSMAWIVT